MHKYKNIKLPGARYQLKKFIDRAKYSLYTCYLAVHRRHHYIVY